jgi:hypothetical protein
MVTVLAFLVASFGALLGFLLWVDRDMRRGLREMWRLTREVEALLDETAPGHR